MRKGTQEKRNLLPITGCVIYDRSERRAWKPDKAKHGISGKAIVILLYYGCGRRKAHGMGERIIESDRLY